MNDAQKAIKRAKEADKRYLKMQAAYDKARARFLEVATDTGKKWLEEMEARIEATKEKSLAEMDARHAETMAWIDDQATPILIPPPPRSHNAPMHYLLAKLPRP